MQMNAGRTVRSPLIAAVAAGQHASLQVAASQHVIRIPPCEARRGNHEHVFTIEHATVYAIQRGSQHNAPGNRLCSSWCDTLPSHCGSEERADESVLRAIIESVVATSC